MASQWLQQYQSPQQSQSSTSAQYAQPPQSGQYMQQSAQYQAQPYQHTQTYQPNQQYQQPQSQWSSNYQQQYAAQQYPSQQPGYHQYGTAQVRGGQQAFQQQTQAATGHAQNQTFTQSCFNCGSPDHFAQNCPEQKRGAPAGAMEPARYTSSWTRSRPGGPVITKYSLPPQAAQGHATPQNFSQVPYSQNGYPQHQAQYNPTTSMSGQSPSYQHHAQQHWQQYYQQQHAYQQSNYQQHGIASQPPVASYQQQTSPNYGQSYLAPTSQGRWQAHNPPVTSTIATNYLHSSTPAVDHTPLSQMQIPQNPADLPQALQQIRPHSIERRVDPEDYQAGQNHSLVSMQPDSVDETPEANGLSNEAFEEDDLLSLDVPDLPKIPAQPDTEFFLQNTVTSPSISLVSQPLPANFVVADALHPFDPPLPNMDGRCQSKYTRDNTETDLLKNIRDSKYWRDHIDDTVFLESPNDEHVVPLDEVLAELEGRRENTEIAIRPTRASRSQSQSVSIKQESTDFCNDLETLERNLAELKAKQAEKIKEMQLRKQAKLKEASPPTDSWGSPSDQQAKVKDEEKPPSRVATPEKSRKSAQDTEAILAALGVTGAPKPVIPNDGPRRTSFHNSPNCELGPSSRRGSRPENPTPSYTSPTNGSFPNIHGFGSQPPPPPPPSDGNTNGNDRGLVSGEYGHAKAYNSEDQISIAPDQAVSGQIVSPNESRILGTRKRSYNPHDSSSDEETPARRQEDDFTPKVKRRQPKVAEAYSRRW